MQRADFHGHRSQLVDRELRSLGVRNAAVLKAMRTVPEKNSFLRNCESLPIEMPLPIAAGQTISQPLVVAHMAESLTLKSKDRILEVGAGSGYAAAVLSRIANEVYAIERVPELAEAAAERLQQLGYENVHVLCGDGTLGWPEHAPYDAIIVSAGGPRVPPALLQQLRIGGRLVIPVGAERKEQDLIRVTRTGEDGFHQENLGPVRFVPLIGAAGWEEGGPATVNRSTADTKVKVGLPELVRQSAEPFSSIEAADLGPLLRRIGDARLVLIGEATHGTSEFYRMRAEITKALIELKNFDFVAVEADWPDAYRIHDFVTHRQREEPHDWEAFARFPTWMWRNHEVLDFIHWLRDFNLERRPHDRRAGFYGLDLYSLFTSIDSVLKYLDRVDPAAAAVARQRYGCLTPWEGDPATYGRAALNRRFHTCESEVVHMLRDLNQRRADAAVKNGEDLFDAQLNAKLVADAERYYRIMYYGSDESWNHRDTHMFETLKLLLDRHGPRSKAVIWEHNSHLGNAAATQFGLRGQLNIGQLCREEFGEAVYAIGQGSDRGTVAAASEWEAPMEIKQVRPSLPESYERLMHLAEMESFFLPLKGARRELTGALAPSRLERAIGVIYRPDTERQSHYFYASMPHQFDEWIWFDETSAVRPLTTRQAGEHEPFHPFAVIDR